MRTPPFLATHVFERLGPADSALLGDLVEEYRRGRSRAWYWSQVLVSVALHSSTRARAQPLQALAVMMAGWLGVLALFFTLGNVTTLALLRHAFDWTPPFRGSGGPEIWWPLQAAGAAVSCLGFALIAVVLVRVNGGRWASMLGPFLLSLAPAQVGIHAARWYVAATWGWNTLFYVAPVGLPYEPIWVPLLMISIALVAGLLGARGRSTIAVCTSSI